MKRFLERKWKIVSLLLGMLLLLATANLSHWWYQSRNSQASSNLLAVVYQKGMYVADRPILSFSQRIVDFNTVNVKIPLEHVYIFTNKGGKALVIHQVQGGCCSDCVTIEWPKKPIHAGEQGEIKVRINKLDQEGDQTYTITVRANTDPPETRLILRGTQSTSYTG